MKVQLSGQILKKLRRISKKVFPKEACSLLIGKFGGGNIIVEEIRETENVHDSDSSFLIDPRVIAEVLDELKSNDRELLGFFHTHPELPAFVSDRDEKFMELWGEKVWIIAGTDVSGNISEIKSFLWKDDEIIEIRIEE
ncbi:hypothetical protein AKJ56_01425 [candidate division MSBL1 archaeon SCGC-AAA382N08]|uniref:JAB1/MPN/MOV34 metalloenzyme domain-containing protein n=1 Tax=candidate division MSBL1 archaeon SCGC-AAA382N08 TaxID=1698285 RepID=A0A133VPM4_9EURY|nr:hypothetical protein AKJ56_01425 [candidate division MSBL1 archaeon SCGC-AAA382N08]